MPEVGTIIYVKQIHQVILLGLLLLTRTILRELPLMAPLMKISLLVRGMDMLRNYLFLAV